MNLLFPPHRLRINHLRYSDLLPFSFYLPWLPMTLAHYTCFYNTPSIWLDRQFDIQQFEFPKVDLSRFQPEPIPANMRLGHQMEYAFKQLVGYTDAYDILVHNLAIRKEKTTLGEIDFILKDNLLHSLIHIEMTYKFYVIDPEITEPIHRLIGPNRKDSFFDKKEKIKNRQFPLLHTEQGAAALDQLSIDHASLDHQCCFKAQLFMPLRTKFADLDVINRACIAGYWIRFSDMKNSAFDNAEYYLPEKSDWVLSPNDHNTWVSHSEILVEISLRLSQERSPLVWKRKSSYEYEKFFVVWW